MTFFLGIIVLLTACVVLTAQAKGVSSQKMMALGFLICLTALYFLLLAGPSSITGLVGVLGFWPGVVLVLVGLFGKNGKRADKEEIGEDDAL